MTEKELFKKCEAECRKYPYGGEQQCVIGELYFRIEELEERLAKAEKTIVELSAEIWL